MLPAKGAGWACSQPDGEENPTPWQQGQKDPSAGSDCEMGQRETRGRELQPAGEPRASDTLFITVSKILQPLQQSKGRTWIYCIPQKRLHGE